MASRRGGGGGMKEYETQTNADLNDPEKNNLSGVAMVYSEAIELD